MSCDLVRLFCVWEQICARSPPASFAAGAFNLWLLLLPLVTGGSLSLARMT